MASNARLPIASHAAFFFQGLCQAFNWKDAFGAFCRQVQGILRYKKKTKNTESNLFFLTDWPLCFFSSAAIRKAMLMTVILNGGIFLGFLVMMEGLYNSPDHQFFGYSYTHPTL
ncbi:hypothetical protein CLU79DRAFT_495762 [Phycomyces nitens]|nr:hypothetical protein CLU79DRAFT_495762 [Phycomyces nitens]